VKNGEKKRRVSQSTREEEKGIRKKVKKENKKGGGRRSKTSKRGRKENLGKGRSPENAVFGGSGSGGRVDQKRLKSTSGKEISTGKKK